MSDGAGVGRDATVATDGAGTTEESTKVAIACQGGGSHTAFTAGALSALVPAVVGSEEAELVGLSGTSGGAICALLSWYDHVVDPRDPSRLVRFWERVAAASSSEALLNDWAVAGVRLESRGLPVPSVSPYATPVARWVRAWLRDLLTDLADLEALGDLAAGTETSLLVGAVDVNSGVARTFADGEITAEAVLASAAVPVLFPAVEFGGHAYWDGLFAENPPLTGLLEGPREATPDEVWVVQVNPQTREEVPTSLVEIADRRSELSGNLALNKDVAAIERVNDWLAAGYLPEDEYKHVEVRRLVLDRELGLATKLDRDPEFVEALVDHGRAEARAFLDDRPGGS